MRKAMILPVALCLLALPASRPPGWAHSGQEPQRGASSGLTGEIWRGPAIAYSGYREGQSPDSGIHPSQEQVEEDLRILARHWRLIRVYGSGRHGRDVLEVIRREKVPLKVMLGIWLGREPGAEQANAREIEEGIRLANEYREIVAAVNVGNEVLIEWTSHRVPEEQVVRYVRKVKGAVPQPVTVADNYVWWRDHGEALAREVDFITMHSYPLWERKDIDEGLSYTVDNYEGVRAAHPERPIIIGEAGWATYTVGNLHVPRGGDEAKQKRYYEELSGWAREKGITVFFFEAFDEPWKGAGTEGHWGFFTVDRKAKPVMQEVYPELKPSGPTSPSYPDDIRPEGPDIRAVLRADLAGIVRHGSVNPLGPGLSGAGVVDLEGADGGRALQLDFTGEGWGGFYLLLGKHDASRSRALAMRLRIDDTVKRLELKLEGPETNAQSVNILEHQTGRSEDGWRSISVPLAAFDRIDLTQLGILGLWKPSDQAGTYLPCRLIVDDIHFE